MLLTAVLMIMCGKLPTAKFIGLLSLGALRAAGLEKRKLIKVDFGYIRYLFEYPDRAKLFLEYHSRPYQNDTTMRESEC